MEREGGVERGVEKACVCVCGGSVCVERMCVERVCEKVCVCGGEGSRRRGCVCVCGEGVWVWRKRCREAGAVVRRNIKLRDMNTTVLVNDV